MVGMLVAMRDPIHFRLSRTAFWACLAVWVAVVGGGCAKDKRDAAMEKLARGGFAFSVDGFHRAAREDNAAMAEHFLAAGMAVDVKRKKAVFDNVYAGLSGPAILPLAAWINRFVAPLPASRSHRWRPR